MAVILVFHNNETAAILVYQTNAVGVELFSHENTFLCFNKFAWLLATRVGTLWSEKNRAAPLWPVNGSYVFFIGERGGPGLSEGRVVSKYFANWGGSHFFFWQGKITPCWEVYRNVKATRLFSEKKFLDYPDPARPNKKVPSLRVI